ncbi:transcription antitermination factor NusB [Mesonia sp. K7]|uniref:transcription antitermination factor NusB n=1 Tax=Mesonia sp. K7 TaxID=2218606 RepID=UPI000DAAAC55|nr:transcription antitermination factor NusB [Mesonia sp. K7]PZD79498.1 transcription antitermination factor NusB [Mesonia sp. K7]
MLTRRHIRVKVMQSIYAFHQSSSDNLPSYEKFLQKSIEEMYHLYLLQFDIFIQLKHQAISYFEILRKKKLATQEEKNPNLKFINNLVLEAIDASDKLRNELEDKKLFNWKKDDEYVRILWDEILKSDLYKEYISTEKQSFEEDKSFIIAIFKEIIAPNESLYDYIEDQKLTWLDDLPIINTAILKDIKKLSEEESLKVSKLFKNQDDQVFSKELLQKTLLNQEEYSKTVQEKTPNWDKDRIAEIDGILMKMAICEFLKFPSIPIKVTINEYVEIAKEYSTPKSSIFINGILDKISKEYLADKKIKKIGRGLM